MLTLHWMLALLSILTNLIGQTLCFENVVIHFGDFHFMKENFQVSVFSTRAI